LIFGNVFRDYKRVRDERRRRGGSESLTMNDPLPIKYILLVQELFLCYISFSPIVKFDLIDTQAVEYCVSVYHNSEIISEEAVCNHIVKLLP